MLREFLLTHRAEIIGRTRSRGARRLPPGAAEDELQTGIPMFLDQVIDVLGRAGGASGAIGEGAVQHGRDLLRIGFTVAQLVHEYGGVSQAITEPPSEGGVSIPADEFHTFNRCLDDAIAHAVAEYGRQREQLIADEGRERLGDLAHELRNALGGAMLSFEILQKGTVGVGGSTAAVLSRSLRRMSTLIDSSIAEVRLASGIHSPERVSVHEFVEEVEIAAAKEASARNITLAVTAVRPRVDVEVDRQLLAAAVANLLHNAFKFSRPRGHVTVKTTSTERRVLIEVDDECGGLPEGKAEMLFRPFEQRSADRTGMGLGLSITRKSVEANGGKLGVRDIPGIGCVFTIDLPRLGTKGQA